MKKVHLLILFFHLSTTYAQIDKSDLIGTWVKIASEMKDGSKIIPIYPDYVNHFNISFTKKEMITDYYPGEISNESASKYRLKKNEIVLSKYFSYSIEKITKDSLIIVEKIDDIREDRLKRHLLLNKTHLTNEKEKSYLNQTEIRADATYSPIFMGSFMRYLNYVIQDNYTNLKLLGEIHILVKEKRVDAYFTYRDKVDIERERALIHFLDNSFTLWDITGFEQYDKVTVDFSLIMEKTKTYKGIRALLFANTFTQLQGRYGLTMQQINGGVEYLKKGVLHVQNKEYQLAITAFTKAFEFNHTLVDALYNRASCYYLLEQYDNACKDWKLLYDLGQTDGIKLHQENCR